MNKYFISDLDKTLIYTKYPSEVCVEYKDCKPISYMTEKSLSLMKKVLTKSIFIPCTMRNLEQTMRIDFIREYNPKFVICQNGANIYIDGKLDLEWAEYMSQFIKADELESMKEKIELLNMPVDRIKIIDRTNIEIKFPEASMCTSFLNLIESQTFEWYKVINAKGSRKINIFHKKINKKYAVEYLIKKYGFEYIFVAGDSLADKDFTRIDNAYSFLPGQAPFVNDNGYKSKYSYIESVEDILSNLLVKLEEN